MSETVHDLGALRALGVNWAGITLPHMPFDQGLDEIRRFGEEVIAKSR